MDPATVRTMGGGPLSAGAGQFACRGDCGAPGGRPDGARRAPGVRARIIAPVLRVQLIIPPGKGPFPVFLTNHPRTRPWVATAVRRGYIGCIYFRRRPDLRQPGRFRLASSRSIRNTISPASRDGRGRACARWTTSTRCPKWTNARSRSADIRAMANRRCSRRRSTNGSQP